MTFYDDFLMNFFIFGLVYFCLGLILATAAFIIIRLVLRKKLLSIKDECSVMFFDEEKTSEANEIKLAEEPFFFEMSVFENIKYGNIAAADEEVAAAAERAGTLHILAERTCQNLTKGERQLVAAARAILKNPHRITVGRGLSEVDLLTVKNLNL
jgi:ABC-type Na+ transport system ATPase subunit NatA